MGRAPCCQKIGLKRGKWSAEEDEILTTYVLAHGQGSWRSLPKHAGLLRCGKSCRLRWINYLRPDLKRGNISPHEEQLIVKLHASLGNKWSLIAGKLPGRTDNEIKNYWNSHLSRRLHCFTSPPAIPPPESKPATWSPPADAVNKRKGSRKTIRAAPMKKKKNTQSSCGPRTDEYSTEQIMMSSTRSLEKESSSKLTTAISWGEENFKRLEGSGDQKNTDEDWSEIISSIERESEMWDLWTEEGKQEVSVSVSGDSPASSVFHVNDNELVVNLREWESSQWDDIIIADNMSAQSTWNPESNVFWDTNNDCSCVEEDQDSSSCDHPTSGENHSALLDWLFS